MKTSSINFDTFQPDTELVSRGNKSHGSFYVFKNTEFMIETCKVPEVFACYLGTLRALGLPLSGDPPKPGNPPPLNMVVQTIFKEHSIEELQQARPSAACAWSC